MTIHTATTSVSQVSVEAKVIRADGRVEDLGTIAFWHRNPFKRWAWAIGRWGSALRVRLATVR